MRARSAVSVGAWPLLTLGAVAVVVVAGQHAEGSAPGALAGTLVAAALCVALLEWRFPYREAWARGQGDTWGDAGLLVLSTAVGDAVVRGLPALLGLLLAMGVPARPGPWPVDWPVAAQLVLALLLGELGGYWTHRLMHRVPLLWRLHALHHSAPRLYWLNATRNHPGDALVSTLASVGPLVLLGAGAAVLEPFTAFVSVHLMLQHANLDTRLGPLRRWLSTGEAHRWHHSRRLEEAEANYGNVLLVWDAVFGTLRIPEGRAPPEDVGLSDAPDFPRSLGGQLLSPWRSALWSRRD